MRQLPSKLVAGGLTAAVVLLWWPRFFPADSVQSWLGRGVVWTLCFELVLLAFRPLEAALWETEQGRRLRCRADAARRRFDVDSPRRRLGGAALVAALAVTASVTALVLGPPHPASQARVATRQVTQVKRIVRVVKKPVQVIAQAPAATGAQPPAAAGPVIRHTPSPRAQRSRPRTQTSQPRHEISEQQPSASPQPQPQQPAGGTSRQPVAG